MHLFGCYLTFIDLHYNRVHYKYHHWKTIIFCYFYISTITLNSFKYKSFWQMCLSLICKGGFPFTLYIYAQLILVRWPLILGYGIDWSVKHLRSVYWAHFATVVYWQIFDNSFILFKSCDSMLFIQIKFEEI